jgi:hypothetical protein
MAKVVEVPEDIRKELEAVLERRYPDLEKSSEVFRSISYDRGSTSSSVYSAAVHYHWQQNSSTALFEYSESVSKQGVREHHWYCKRDWLD